MIELDKLKKTKILMLMASLVVLGMSAIDIYIAALPQMVIEFNSFPNIINLTISAYTLGIAFAMLFIGEFSNRFGRRKVIIGGVLSFSITSFLIAITPSIYIIIGLRLIQAISCSSFIIIPRMIIKDCMDEREQINANGMLLLGVIISPAIAPVIGAYITEYLGWRNCFTFSGFLGIILSCLVVKWLPETNLAPIKQFAPVRHYINIYCKLLSNRIFIALTAIYATTVGVYFAFIGISSYLYIDNWHFSPVKYAYIYILLSLAYFVGNHIMRILNHSLFSASRIIGVGVYLAFCGSIIMLLAVCFFNAGSWLVITFTFGMTLTRVANAVIIPPTQIRVMSQFAPYSAQALGLNMCIGFIANSLAIFFVSEIEFKLLVSFILTSIMLVLIAVFFYKMNYKSL